MGNGEVSICMYEARSIIMQDGCACRLYLVCISKYYQLLSNLCNTYSDAAERRITSVAILWTSDGKVIPGNGK